MTSLDGSATQVITVTIDGADEVVGLATITGTANATIGEDDLSIVGGDLDISDPDIGQALFQMPDSLVGLFGTFTFDPATGAWTYDVDNASAAVQALNTGEILTDTLVVTAFDGSVSQPIIVTITGADEIVGGATITGVANGTIGEDDLGIVAGDLDIDDPDIGDDVFQTPASLDGAFGAFTFDPDSGAWSYDLDNAKPEVQALKSGDILTDSLTVTSKDGSASQVITVTITGSNDAPVVSLPLFDQAATEINAFSYTIPAGSFSDIDAGTVLELSATLESGDDLPAWLSFDPVSGTFTGTPPEGSAGTVTVTVTAWDGETSVSDDFVITIVDDNVGTDGNTAPLVVNPLADQAAVENNAFSFAVPAGSFVDADAGDVLVYSASQADGSDLPDWLDFNPANQTFTGTPPEGSAGTVQVRVIVFDGQVTTSDDFDITISDDGDGGGNGNSAPIVANPIADQSVVELNAFSLTVSANTFFDANGDDLTLTATLANGNDLPDWLSFDGTTFTGTPPDGSAGTLSVKVIAFDGTVSTFDSFDITIVDDGNSGGGNNPPVVSHPLADQTAIIDNAFSFSILPGAFTDADGDDLALSVTLSNGDDLPEWLGFDAVEGIFTGTPPAGATGTITIRVTASDGQATTFDEFNIVIADPEIGANGNTVPLVVNPLADQAALEGNAFSFAVLAGTFFDADGDALDLTATLADGNDLPDWLSFDGATFTGTPPDGSAGTVSVKVTASDGQSATFDTFDIVVNPAETGINGNTVPVVANPIADQAEVIGTAFSFDVPVGTFFDGDGDTLGLTATLASGHQLPGWLSFDGTTFTGTPPDGSAGTISIKVVASDGSNSTYDSFDIVISDPVAGGNTAPDIGIALADQEAIIGNAFSFAVQAGAFVDADGDELSYAATLADGSDLPDWLSFNAVTQTFTGTPPAGSAGTISVMVTASDGQASISDVFDIAINEAEAPVGDNIVPVVVNPLTDQAVVVGNAFSYDMPSNTFFDGNGDALSYTATLFNGDPLPAWLSFDAVNGIFTGTPPEGSVGNVAIKVTASDGQSSTFDSFYIAVNAADVSVDGNAVPVVVVPLLDQTATEGSVFAFAIPDGAFMDADPLDTLSYTASLANGLALPDWLEFNPQDGTFTGTPPAGSAGALSVKVTASDGKSTTFDTFDLVVAPFNAGNVAPEWDNALENVHARIDRLFTFVIPADAVSDADIGDTLTLDEADQWRSAAGLGFILILQQKPLAAHRPTTPGF